VSDAELSKAAHHYPCHAFRLASPATRCVPDAQHDTDIALNTRCIPSVQHDADIALNTRCIPDARHDAYVALESLAVTWPDQTSQAERGACQMSLLRITWPSELHRASLASASNIVRAQASYFCTPSGPHSYLYTFWANIVQALVHLLGQKAKQRRRLRPDAPPSLQTTSMSSLGTASHPQMQARVSSMYMTTHRIKQHHIHRCKRVYLPCT